VLILVLCYTKLISDFLKLFENSSSYKKIGAWHKIQIVTFTRNVLWCNIYIIKYNENNLFVHAV